MRIRHVPWLVLTLLPVTVSAPAIAQEKPWHAALMATWIEDDNDRNVDDGLHGITVSAGKDLNLDWTVEGSASYFNLDAESGNDQDQITVGVDVLRKFLQSEYISPYFVMGAGYIDTDKDRGDDDQGAMASAGFGFLTPVKWRGASFRFEGRVRQDFSSGGSGYTDWIANFGLQFPFGANFERGAPRPVPEKKEQPPLPGSTLPEATFPPPDASKMDSDADGVSDDKDMCGGTPAGKPVDKFGCATDETAS